MHTTRTTGRTAAGRAATGLAALSLAGMLALTGCGASDTAANGGKAADRGAAPEAADRAGQSAAGAKGSGTTASRPGAPAKPPAVRSHIIRTANLSIEAKSAQQALATARAAAVDAGGYVGNESSRRNPGSGMVSQVTLRVPADRFDHVLGALEGSGKLLSRTVNAQDVTQQVVDVESRIKSQQASVARVRQMMERADALSDVVMLESELSRRQSDLESLLTQQESLKDRTSLATITLSVSEPAKVVVTEEKEEAEPGFLDALSGGWSVFLAVVRWITLVFGALLPFLVPAAVLVALRRPLGRLYRRVRPSRPAPEREAAGPWVVRAPAGPAAPVAPAVPVVPPQGPGAGAGDGAGSEDGSGPGSGNV
ncbi:DUF4349 domain-containing protein [Streptomyces bambusae]|uniref:DUF4349 domain-containing protein n=1 Tax=Streptomyces bambusae TaxID=1550616 RepID=UPI001CFDB61F|nr:DUF4349 domain-containing protein [Streptomyces bambusae]MCB5165559.1 DUF4349 domain-containing protein [Streptomyces bambusae]